MEALRTMLHKTLAPVNLVKLNIKINDHSILPEHWKQRNKKIHHCDSVNHGMFSNTLKHLPSGRQFPQVMRTAKWIGLLSPFSAEVNTDRSE